MGLVVEAVELRGVALPLRRPFRASYGTETARRSLLIRVITADGDGWGECVALSEPLYSPEYVDGATAVIRDHLLPRLWSAGAITAGGVAPALAAVRGHPMAKSAVEMAVLDAELQRSGRSLASHLGADRTLVPAGVSVGMAPVAQLLDAVAGYVDAGYRRVKLKIGPGSDIEPVRAVRERFGNELLLQVDANGAYRLTDADSLAALDDWGLLMIEQPLAEDDLLGHAELARRLRTPICLDESITSARAAATAITLGACRVVNIKPGRVGGYLEAQRVHDVCVESGVAAWCGGMLETGIGRAANLALAALPGFTLPGDVSPPDDYLAEDLTPPLVLNEGCLTVPSGPGIGVPILADVVQRFTTSVELVRAPERRVGAGA